MWRSMVLTVEEIHGPHKDGGQMSLRRWRSMVRMVDEIRSPHWWTRSMGLMVDEIHES